MLSAKRQSPQPPGLCLLLGSGGHARVLLDALLEGGCPAQQLILLDADRCRWGQNMFGVPILGDDSLIPDLVARGAGSFVVAVGSVKNCGQRRRMFELGLSHGLEPVTVRHPAGVCSRHAQIGAGVQLLAGSVVNPGASVGVNVIINTGVVIEHDCIVGDHVHVATGARLGGGVRVGSEALIGLGASVRQGIAVGAGAVVGAGSVVVRDVVSGTVVAGVPARLLTDGPLGR